MKTFYMRTYIVDYALHKTYPVQRSYKTEKHYKLAPTVVPCAKKNKAQILDQQTSLKLC